MLYYPTGAFDICTCDFYRTFLPIYVLFFVDFKFKYAILYIKFFIRSDNKMKITPIGESQIIIQNPYSKHAYFAWPTAIRLQDNKIAVAASGFRLSHVCPFGKSVIAFSEDEAKTYTPAAPVIDTPLDDRDSGLCTFGKSGLIFTSFNNSINFQREENEKNALRDDADKAYVNAYLDSVNKNDESNLIGSTFRVSFDCGKTYSPIYKSPVTSPHGPVCLSDGSILWVGTSFDTSPSEKEELIEAYKINPNDGSCSYVGKVEKIKDENENNEKFITIPSVDEDYIEVERPEYLISCEPYAIELDDGSILCHIRVEPTFTLYQTKSFDKGKTWTTPKRLLPDMGGAPSHILKHSSGALIATYSYRKNPFGIKALISYDNGESWADAGYIYKNEYSFDLGYPSCVELGDGSIICVFYTRLSSDSPAVIMQQRWSLEK